MMLWERDSSKRIYFPSGLVYFSLVKCLYLKELTLEIIYMDNKAVEGVQISRQLPPTDSEHYSLLLVNRHLSQIYVWFHCLQIWFDRYQRTNTFWFAMSSIHSHLHWCYYYKSQGYTITGCVVKDAKSHKLYSRTFHAEYHSKRSLMTIDWIRIINHSVSYYWFESNQINLDVIISNAQQLHSFVHIREEKKVVYNLVISKDDVWFISFTNPGIAGLDSNISSFCKRFRTAGDSIHLTQR